MTTEKKKYSSVAIPKDLVKDVLELIDITGLYRSHSEFFIDAGRQRYLEIIKALYRKKNTLRRSERKSKI